LTFAISHLILHIYSQKPGLLPIVNSYIPHEKEACIQNQPYTNDGDTRLVLAIYNGGIIPSIPLNHQYDIFDAG
jgi:hypothetical protein